MDYSRRNNSYAETPQNENSENYYNGEQNAKTVSNKGTFALLSDGEIKTWGQPSYGGITAPAGNDFASISSNGYAFVAIKNDGTLAAWGNPLYGGASSDGTVTIADGTSTKNVPYI